MYCTNCYSSVETDLEPCPRCGKSGTASAQVAAPKLRRNQSAERIAAKRSMLIWATVTTTGVVLTTATYLSAQPGSRFVVFWGAIIFGLIQLVRAFIRWSDSD